MKKNLKIPLRKLNLNYLFTYQYDRKTIHFIYRFSNTDFNFTAMIQSGFCYGTFLYQMNLTFSNFLMMTKFKNVFWYAILLKGHGPDFIQNLFFRF